VGSVRFDAQCDFASVVYGRDDDPDRLFFDFTDDLYRSGFRPVGVIQSGRNCRAEDTKLRVVVLPGGETIGLAADKAECDAGGCRVDDQRLSELAKRLTAAIDDGPDLVVINRFGRAEAEGRGLIKPIAQALKADIPVLIAVPERRFSDWIRFSDGMNVRLPCRREALDRWWRSVEGTSVCRRRGAGATFCEWAK
jgi:nucleoside-triphosphatase THEP1